MKLDIDFTALENLVKAMGASQVSWESNVTVINLESDWKITLETIGFNVDNLKDIEISVNGLLHYRGEQILLHIKEAIGLPRFHFYDCGTLKAMKVTGRFDRYIVTQRKDGTFLIDKKIGYNEYNRDKVEKLPVCSHCLKWYNKNYRKNYSVANFDITEFFTHFTQTPISYKPTYTDENAPASGYSDDWNIISSQLKKACGYICQECKFDFSKNPQWLHTHHVNGVKSDNSDSNLKVLCIDCHAKQPSHSHINSRFFREIQAIRKIKQNNY